MGAVERANQTIMGKIRKLSEFGKHPWHTRIDKATLAYNISFHRALNTSPMIIKYGNSPYTEIDKKFGIPEKKIPLSTTRQKRDEKFDKYADKYIKKGKIEITEALESGEKVLVYRGRLGGKLDRCWIPGYKIVGKKGPDAYVVEKGALQYRVNKNSVKRQRI